MPKRVAITKAELIKIIQAYKKQSSASIPYTRHKGKKMTKAQIEAKWMKNPTVKKRVEEVKKSNNRVSTPKQSTISSYFVRK